jgi:hypothetical protein
MVELEDADIGFAAIRARMLTQVREQSYPHILPLQSYLDHRALHVVRPVRLVVRASIRGLALTAVVGPPPSRKFLNGNL